MAPADHREIRALGEAIRHRRNDIGVSQEDFAEMCGLHRTYVGQVERGEKNISFENILRIATALGIKPSRLFGDAKL